VLPLFTAADEGYSLYVMPGTFVRRPEGRVRHCEHFDCDEFVTALKGAGVKCEGVASDMKALILLRFPRGAIVRFSADLVHAGANFFAEHVRLHAYIRTSSGPTKEHETCFVNLPDLRTEGGAGSGGGGGGSGGSDGADAARGRKRHKGTCTQTAAVASAAAAAIPSAAASGPGSSSTGT